jgi:hypothetical protein
MVAVQVFHRTATQQSGTFPTVVSSGSTLTCFFLLVNVVTLLSPSVSLELRRFQIWTAPPLPPRSGPSVTHPTAPAPAPRAPPTPTLQSPPTPPRRRCMWASTEKRPLKKTKKLNKTLPFFPSIPRNKTTPQPLSISPLVFLISAASSPLLSPASLGFPRRRIRNPCSRARLVSLLLLPC